ncbi:MAG: DMT family transporter [Alphaproteobacteria bacterium]
MLDGMEATGTIAAPAGPVRAALWMVGSCACFTVLTALIRYLSATIDPLEIVFFRNLFGMAVMLPWLFHRGLGALTTTRLPLHALRALVGLVAMIAWFTAVSRMNLADAVALSFTSPLFATVAAIFLLSEVVRLRRWLAIGAGFLGAMIILRPGFAEIPPAALLVLLSSMAMGFAVSLVKILTRHDASEPIVFYMVLFLTPASLVPALFVWQTPTLDELGLLVALGGMATLGHLCLVRAFASADATAVLPFDFVRLPLIALAGYLVFDETLDVWTGLGAAIILSSSVYIAHREATHRRVVAVPTPRLDAAIPVRARSERRDAAE